MFILVDIYSGDFSSMSTARTLRFVADMHVSGVSATCLPLVTERLHICLSPRRGHPRHDGFSIRRYLQSRRVVSMYTCENKVQDLFLPHPSSFFIYSFIPYVNVKMDQTDECMRQVYRSQIFLSFFFFK